MFSDDCFKNLNCKKIALEIVSYGEDVTVAFVDNFGDYKVKVSDSNKDCEKTIKIKIVENFPSVKLEKVTHFEDYEIYIM